jgi:hypothetical protein
MTNIIVQPESGAPYARHKADLQCRLHWASINATCLGILTPSIKEDEITLRCNQCANVLHILVINKEHLESLKKASIRSADLSGKETKAPSSPKPKPKPKLTLVSSKVLTEEERTDIL